MEKHFNPAVKAALNRTAEIIRDEESAWQVYLERLKPEVSWTLGPDSVTMRISSLNGLHVAEKRRLIREGFRYIKGQLRALERGHVEAILNLLAGEKGRGLDLPGRNRAWTKDDFLFIGISLEEHETSFEYSLPLPGLVYIEEMGSGIESEIDRDPKDINPRKLGPDMAVLDFDLIEPPLIVRNLRPGDRFQPLGLKGTKKLHDFFIDAKVPASERREIPLVLDRKGIIWVVGLRVSERTRFSAGTKTALFLKFNKPPRTENRNFS